MKLSNEFIGVSVLHMIRGPYKGTVKRVDDRYENSLERYENDVWTSNGMLIDASATHPEENIAKYIRLRPRNVDDWLTIKKFASHMCVHVNTVKYWLKRGMPFRSRKIYKGIKTGIPVNLAERWHQIWSRKVGTPGFMMRTELEYELFMGTPNVYWPKAERAENADPRFRR